MFGKTYSYALSFTVPLNLFPASISGFGFGLVQETALKGENHNLLWVWPPQTLPGNPSITDPTFAALLGDLNLSSKPRR